MMFRYNLVVLATTIFWVRFTEGFKATIAVRSSPTVSLHAMPPPYYPATGGSLASSTSNLKPGRSYAPTNPGVKHTSSREEGYLANLNRVNQGEGGMTSSGVPGGYAPYQPTSYTPTTSTPSYSAEPPKVVTALTADGEGGRRIASLVARSASKPPTKSAPIANERMTDTPIKGRVYIKGDGHDRSDASASVYVNPTHERVPVAATTAPVHVRNALRDGYESQLVPSWRRTNSFAPTQSDVKFKAASSGSSYLESLSQPPVYRPPVVSRMDDPFATSKKAAQAVSGILQCDPRSGESFSSDPFAVSKRAADAVSLLLIKYTEPKDVLFYLA